MKTRKEKASGKTRFLWENSRIVQFSRPICWLSKYQPSTDKRVMNPGLLLKEEYLHLITTAITFKSLDFN